MCQRETKLMLLTICLTGLMGVYVQAAVPPGSYQVQIVAADMCCKGCAQKVAGQLYAAPGVTAVDVNLESKTLAVTVSQKKGGRSNNSGKRSWPAKVVPPHSQPTTLRSRSRRLRHSTKAKPCRQPRVTSSLKISATRDVRKKIANQLYTTDGVVKVSADAPQNTLIVTSQQAISPWALIAAVTKAQERPVAILGAYGQLSIAWSANKAGISNQQAQQSNNGGIQR